MRAPWTIPLLLCSGLLLGCARAPAPGTPPAESAGAPAAAAPAAATSLWALDLVRTRPGLQGEYLRSIEANWGGARHLAAEQGVVRSYLALTAAPDSARGWDVMLLTEYADSAAFAQREETFRAIFASPRYLAGAVTPGRPSSELRDFLVGEVVLRAVVTGGH